MRPGLVMPLIISAGGVVDKTFYKFLKKVFPDGDQRRRLLLGMDVVLARGRGQIYSRATVVARLVFMRLVSIAVRGLGPGQLTVIHEFILLYRTCTCFKCSKNASYGKIE